MMHMCSCVYTFILYIYHACICSCMVSTDPNNFIHCIYSSKHVCTSFSRNKKNCVIAGIEPKTLCILTSCLNRLATSVLAMTGRVIVYVYFLPGRWPRVSHIWRWTRNTPQPGHVVASPCINKDRFKARASLVAVPGHLAAADIDQRTLVLDLEGLF